LLYIVFKLRILKLSIISKF